MCYNCGCQNPYDDMGHSDNITEPTLQHLATHWGKDLKQTKLTLLNMLETNDKALEEEPHLKEMFEKDIKLGKIKIYDLNREQK